MAFEINVIFFHGEDRVVVLSVVMLVLKQELDGHYAKDLIEVTKVILDKLIQDFKLLIDNVDQVSVHIGIYVVVCADIHKLYEVDYDTHCTV